MTSTTGTDSHPEVAEISALSEGILAPDRSADVREHIAGCALCADVLDSLEQIRGLLGTLPGPARMPADIAGRIDAALAAEALLDATLPPRVPRGTSVDVPRGTSSGPGSRADASTGPGRGGRTEKSGSRPAARGRRRGWGVLVTVSVIATAVLGGLLYLAVNMSGGVTTDSSAASSKVKQADGSSVSATVENRVRQLLNASTLDHAQSPLLSENGGTTPAGPKAPSAAAVPSCVLKATHRSQTPLASDREPFQGTDAYLLVLPHPGDSAAVDAFVVNASCTATAPGMVLFQNTYPR